MKISASFLILATMAGATVPLHADDLPMENLESPGVIGSYDLESGTNEEMSAPLAHPQAIEPVRDRKISALEHELLAILSGDYESPHARQEAIVAWRSKNGHLLEAERETESLRLQPERSATLAALRDQRNQQFKEMSDSGRLGSKEAEFSRFLLNEYESPQARQEAINAWKITNAAALSAERDQRRAKNEPLREAKAADDRDVRRNQIAESVASGLLGPVEGQFQAILTGVYSNPLERQEAIRTWMARNRNALESEKAARRATDKR